MFRVVCCAGLALILALVPPLAGQTAEVQVIEPGPDPELSTDELRTLLRSYPEPMLRALRIVAEQPDLLPFLAAQPESMEAPDQIEPALTAEVQDAIRTLQAAPELVRLAAARVDEVLALLAELLPAALPAEPPVVVENAPIDDQPYFRQDDGYVYGGGTIVHTPDDFYDGGSYYGGIGTYYGGTGVYFGGPYYSPYWTYGYTGLPIVVYNFPQRYSYHRHRYWRNYGAPYGGPYWRNYGAPYGEHGGHWDGDRDRDGRRGLVYRGDAHRSRGPINVDTTRRAIVSRPTTPGSRTREPRVLRPAVRREGSGSSLLERLRRGQGLGGTVGTNPRIGSTPTVPGPRTGTIQRTPGRSGGIRSAPAARPGASRSPAVPRTPSISRSPTAARRTVTTPRISPGVSRSTPGISRPAPTARPAAPPVQRGTTPAGGGGQKAVQRTPRR